MNPYRRKKLEKVYSHLYNFAPYSISDQGFIECVYCGLPADTWDHCPPLERIHDFRTLYGDGLYIKVKSCRECNSVLSDSLQADILERIEVLKHRLKRKLGGDTEGLWGEDEIADLGPNLRSLIKGSIAKERRTMERIRYVEGLRGILNWEPVRRRRKR